MLVFGLTGWPVNHSLSPVLYKSALRAVGIDGYYQLLPIDPSEPSKLIDLLNKVRSGEISGLNVTIPHKQSVIQLVDQLTSSANSIGAVNTIYMKDDQLFGHNTDAPGFLADLKQKNKIDFHSKKRVIVIGAGGSARAIVWALAGLSSRITIASRKIEQSRKLGAEFNQEFAGCEIHSTTMDASGLAVQLDNVDLVVNTTPVGMFPDTNYSPWPVGLLFPANAFVYDLVYNPRQTTLVENARKAGLAAENGLGMLIEQAALAFEIWTGVQAPRDVMYSSVG